MSTSSEHVKKRVARHLQEFSKRRESDLHKSLREDTSKLDMSMMQISPEQGQMMHVLTKLLNVKRAIEVGVFTGYSALRVAEAMPDDGTLVACDISKEWTDKAKPFWKDAGVDQRIDLRIGPAERTLRKMVEAGEGGTYDFAFIDADKTGYDAYYERCLELLRPGGAILFDNMFMGGDALKSNPHGPDATAIHVLTFKIFKDKRVDPCLIPISDGVLLLHKR